MTREYPIYLDGSFVQTDSPLDVTNPYNGSVVGRTWFAGPDELDRATIAAQRSFEALRTSPVFERAALLHDLAASMQKHQKDLIDVLVQEAGNPLDDELVEVDRGALTVQIAAEGSSGL